MKLKLTRPVALFTLSLMFASVAHAAETKVISLKVNGMTSPTCPTLLKSAVRKIKGVKGVQASLETRSATIEYEEGVTNLQAIQEQIESAVGFTTEVN